METFDPMIISEIESFNGKLNSFKGENLTNEFLVYNLEKTLAYLKTIQTDEILSIKTKKLLVLLVNLTFKTKDRPVSIRENLIKQTNFHCIFKSIFIYLMKSTDNDKNECMALLVASLNNFTFESVYIAKENLNSDIIRLCVDCLQSNNYLSQLNSNQLTTKQSLYLFDNIIRFLLSNCEELNMKHEDLNCLNVIQIIVENKKKLDDALKRNPRMNELKMIEVRLVGILACLMDDNELEKYLEVSNEIANKLMQILNETIKKSKSNTLVLNTKFYISYEINLVPTYVYARSIMKRILNICVNDTIKQIVVDLKGLGPIMTLLERGNEREKLYSTELICSLCFNRQTVDSLRTNKKSMKSIQDLLATTENGQIRNNCKQIVEMVKNTLEKRINETPVQNLDSQQAHEGESDTGFVMISYSWTYKNECLKLNSELKNRGLLTWIDVDNMSENLFDGMSRAIETCTVVLICFSDEYRQSVNCRLEAEYAFKIKKPVVFVRMQANYQPQGWFGLMMGQRIFVDFADSTDSDSTVRISEIVRQINMITSNKILSLPQVSAKMEQNESKNTDNNVNNWSTLDVRNWLCKNDLLDFEAAFKQYDGICFKALGELKADNSEKFFSAIDKQLDESGVVVPIRKKLLFYHYFSKLK
jgi:hypothetical protein